MAKSKPKAKPSKASKLPNLANLVKRAALARGMPSDEELSRLALLLIHECPDDLDHHAVRLKTKLDALRFLHELNMDNKPQDKPDTSEDAELAELLKRRAQ